MIYKEITFKEYREFPSKVGCFKVTYDSSTASYSFLINGEPHRTDGPAQCGSKPWMKQWFLNGIRYPKEEWFSLLTEEQLAIALSNPENF